MTVMRCKMKILIACEESQRVCIEFRKKGHEAYSCDLLPPSGGYPQYHICGNVLNLLHANCSFATYDGIMHFVEAWDMLIAFPPCTYLTKAGACNIPKDPQRLQKGFDAREFFMTLYNAPIKHIAIENPIPMKIFELPKPSMHFQPYEFEGEGNENAYTKYTYLWLKNLPPLLPTTDYPRGYKFPSWCAVNSSGIKTRSINRSKTFPGVARAMAQQWGAL